jgi:hypothetical protein
MCHCFGAFISPSKNKNMSFQLRFSGRAKLKKDNFVGAINFYAHLSASF